MMKAGRQFWLRIPTRRGNVAAGIFASMFKMWSIVMRDIHPVPSDAADVHDTLTFSQRETLERAVAKIVLLGEQVGVSADQMILLLKSGLTVGELVEYLASRNGEHC